MDQIYTSISQYLANVNVNEDKTKEIASNLAQQIDSKNIKLLDLVKALGDYLTADDDLLRPRATGCLSQTLAELSKSALSRHDLQVLIEFYLLKLEDVKSTKETLFGIDTLIGMDAFPQANIKALLSALNNQYNQSQHLASTRFFTFDILANLFELYPDQIKKSQKLYIETFISIASGEKDPKNLLRSFALNSKICKTLEITDFKDDLFDVLFCYFPISFKPPKDDPYKITSEELKQQLRTAIASSAEFSKDSYPNLLEKLTSTSPTVKHDTIETINECISNYGSESLKDHYVELWDALKFEILHGDPDDDEDRLFPPILRIFTTMAKIGPSEFIQLVMKELHENIQRVTSKQKQSCIVLAALASSNVENFNTIVQPTLTLLLKDQSSLSVSDQRKLITNIGFFSTAYASVFGTIQDAKQPPSSDNSLLAFKDEILILLGKALMSSSKIEVSLRTLSIAELTKSTTLLDFLAPSELSLLVQYFTETVLVDDNEYVYGAGIAGLVTVSDVDSSVLIEVTYPLLISLFPENDTDEVVINDEVKDKKKVFEVLKAITRDRESCKWVVEKLVAKFAQVDSQDSGYQFQIAETLLIVLKEVQRSKQFNTDLFLSLIPELENLVNDANDSVLEVVGDFIKLVVVYSDRAAHQELVDQSIEEYPIISKENKLVNIFLKIIAGVDKSVKFSDDANTYVSKLIEFIKTTEFKDMYTKLGYLQLLSILINKFITDVTQYLTYLDSGITGPKLEIFTWISKAVILKNDSSSSKFIEILTSYLSNEQYGTITTKSFEILVIDLPIFDKFKKIQNNNVRLLYKQKFFEIISPTLVSNFKSTLHLKTKSNYLTALSYILKHTKREIIIPHLTLFFPLLLQALSLPNPDVRYASVNTILSTIDEIQDLVSSHLTTLVINLLKLVDKNDKVNKADVRLVSLNCLEALTHVVELQKLVPYQQRILKDLSPVLDDPKRKVRKAAVDARQAYFELGRTVD